MKDSRSTNESPTDLCDESNQEIKDELEPGFVEERFRVDRKKLEQMLQGKLLKLHTSGKSTRHSEEYIFIFFSCCRTADESLTTFSVATF
jgi:hypothetical protein